MEKLLFFPKRPTSSLRRKVINESYLLLRNQIPFKASKSHYLHFSSFDKNTNFVYRIQLLITGLFLYWSAAYIEVRIKKKIRFHGNPSIPPISIKFILIFEITTCAYVFLLSLSYSFHVWNDLPEHTLALCE